MLVEIHPDNPQEHRLDEAVKVLKSGGLIIYPTDTIYAIGCDINHQKAVEKMAQIKGVKMEQANFSLICYDLSHLSNYAKPLDSSVFKLMKRSLPGPYTFILPASKSVPRLFTSKKKTIGIRVPHNDIARSIVLKLGNPIVSTSVHDDDEVLEYTTDPELIYDRYKDKVDMVISSGFGKNVASTVFDCTGEEPVVIRQGAGDTEGLI